MEPMDGDTTRLALFRREGEYWTIACHGRLIRVRDAKGLGYLSRLIRAPARRFHVDDLLGPRPGRDPAGEAVPPRSIADRKRVAVTKALRSALRRIAAHDPALGAILDRAVRTGTFCSYEPGPDGPVWEG